MTATDESALAHILTTAQQTPIAQLSPDPPTPASRVVRGEVTITWPYNSLKQTLAFLLAEADVRLRRSKGQVRVELQGPSAKAAAACNLGGGDQLALSLDGVEWTKDQSTARLPGSRIEWQLKFTGKLLLEIKSGEEEQSVKYVNIDEPVPVDNHEPTLQVIADSVEREITPPAPPRPAIQRMVANDDLEEFSSPAFIKRARVSYGSLFESGFDIFEDDGGVKGKGRKRTRFGRDSSAWRYASHSPSPEPEEEQASESEEVTRATALSSPPRAQMTDEGCQTVELDVPVASPRIETPPTMEQPHSAQPAEPDMPLTLPPTTVNGTTTSPMAVDIPTQEPPQAEGLTTSSEPFGSALFGSFMPSGDAFGGLNQFPTANSAANFGENQVPISDQVRFGFAQPVASMEPTPHAISNLPHAPFDTHEHYPEEHLGSGDASLQHSGFGFDDREAASALIAQQSALPAPSAPPASHGEVHEEGMLWPITSETLDAQHAEGHVDLALPPEPTAEASEVDTTSRSPTRQALPPEVDDYGYNARRYQNEAEERMVGMIDRPEEDEDEEDDDAVDHNEEEPDDAGDDYDMRNYADVDDDEDGFEQYDDEEGGEYPEGEMLSPDDEEGSYDEDEEEEDYESDDEEQQHGAAQSPAPSGPPVVIDLISDSEDEDQPPRPAAQTIPSAVSQPMAQPPRVDRAGEGGLEKNEERRAKHNIPARTSGQPFAAAGSITTGNLAAQQPSDEVEDAQSPSYELQSDESGEDYEEDADADALGESEEEPEEESSGAEADDIGMDRPLSPEHVDAEEPELIEEEVKEQRIEISETVQVTHQGGMEATAVVETTSTTIATANEDMDSAEIVESIIETRESLVSGPEPQVLTTESADTGEVGRLENIDQGNIAPSSPPLSQQIKSQVFGDQPFVLSSPLPPSQLREDQLPTPRETQAKEDSVSHHESSMLVDEEIDEPVPEPSSVPGSTALPQSESSEDVAQEVELLSAQPETDGQEEDAPMVDAISEEPQAPPAEAVSEEPTVSSPIPEAKEADLGEERDQSQATQASKDTIGVTPALVEKEQVVEPVEEAVKPGQEDEEQEAVPLDASQSGRDLEKDPGQQQDESKKDEEPTEASAAEGPAVHTRSRTKDTKEPPPAKSTTRTKAKPAPIDPSIQLARAARRGKRHQEPESPTVTTRARSRSVQQSATPELQDASVQLARAALESPSRKTQHPPAPPAAAAAAKTSTASAASLKLELAKRLRTDLPECVALKTLKTHLNRKLDVLAIATTPSSEAKRLKTRQYALSFNVTDPSTAPLHVVEVQVYRAHKDSLPTVKPGDGVLLRGFQVVALTGKDFGLRSDEASGYAVFEQEGSGEPQINGPPVEDIGAEAGYAETLKEWYGLLDGAAQDKLAKANKKFADVTAGKSK